MASTSQAIAAWRALVTQLDARAGLDGVSFFSAHPGKDLPLEAIVLDGFEGVQEWAAIGRLRKDEDFTLQLAILRVTPLTGDTETVSRSTQDRVLAIFAEIEAQLASDPTINNTVRVARPDEYRLTQGYGDQTRWAELSLDVVAQVRLNAT